MASGATDSAPSAAHAALSVPSAHRIDELSIVGSATPGGRGPAHTVGPTLAWIESWYDKRGGYRSQVQVADLAHPNADAIVRRAAARSPRLSPSPRAPVAISCSSWKACDIGGSCSVRVVLRRRASGSARRRRVGSVDTGEEPAATLAPDGTGLVGWIDHGQVLAAGLPRPRHGSPPRKWSRTRDLTVASRSASDRPAPRSPCGPRARSAPEVFGAVYKR